MDIRVLRPSDIPHVQLANITNLPENYFCKYYLYHAMSWPQLSYVAVDVGDIQFLYDSSSLPFQAFGSRLSYGNYVEFRARALELLSGKEELGRGN